MTDLVEFIIDRITEDELWAKAASAPRNAEDGGAPVAGGVHWTWAVGDRWEPVQPDPLEPFMGGYDGQWSRAVVLRTVEEWQLSWGGPGNTLPVKIAESEELRTADGAHIARHDPARVLRDVALHRALLQYCREGLSDDETVEYPAYLLRMLGAVWSDHPAFSSEWLPEEEQDHAG
ncbi:hypothetical protein Drose_04305 [Dactylosporangium roseum]|uniref:DinB-like domain-containing protein n=1 Tax=Dactylosporangium roseum TaxID=47989 RepID=A0ABY5Z9L5_9ACTN|nr:DUF6221 family protein [Dactylosporangium roseum]UWZ37512.1 hypothetical protein Drose_04305 [Dactylosporangium roseum]